MSSQNAFVRFISFIWSGVDGLRKALHLILLLVLFAVILGAMSSGGPILPERAALVITPFGTLVEQLEGDPYDRALAELVDEADPQTRVRDVVDGLAFAKDDPRIEAVVLDLGGFAGSGLSKLEQVADAIIDFRSSGKPLVATASVYSQGAYYLAAHADDIYLHPDGFFLPSGFDMYSSYYKNAIDKLQIDWNIFRVGTHKSAVEPFEREDMSPEDRESRQRLLDQLWANYERQIVVARELDDGALNDFTQNLLEHLQEHDNDIAETAQALGFVDELVTDGELRERLIAMVGENDAYEGGYNAVGLTDYLDQKRLLSGSPRKEENVAVVVAAGQIVNGVQPPGTIGGESTARLLRRARNDDSVKAVVLRVDSPGGSSFASEQIRNEIEALRADGKPVVASMGSLAASGGYWISMAADRIYARETTITGSIGIFGMFPTFERSLSELGITTDGVGTTRWAGQFRADRTMSEDARQLVQTLVNDGYDDFISKVAEDRGIEKDAVDAIAQGQVWTGADALENGLIDDIGSLDDAVLAAAELAGLDADGYGIAYLEQELDATEQLIVDLLSSATRIGVSPELFRPRSGGKLLELASMLDDSLLNLSRFNDPKGIYAHCFCSVSVQ